MSTRGDDIQSAAGLYVNFNPPCREIWNGTTIAIRQRQRPEMNTPYVSILMAARNEAATIGAAIASIQRQTLRAWELIVIDDDSIDRTADIAISMADHDRRIRVLQTEGVGAAEARNRGAALARGRMLAVMDGDDVAFPTWLESQLMTWRIQGQPTVVTCRFIILNELGQGRSPCLPAHGADIEGLFRKGHMPVAHGGSLVRLGAFLDVGGYNPDLKRLEDFDLFLKLQAAGGRLAVNKEVLFIYRVEDRSRADKGKRIRDFIMKLRIISSHHDRETPLVMSTLGVLLHQIRETLTATRCIESDAVEATPEQVSWL